MRVKAALVSTTLNEPPRRNDASPHTYSCLHFRVPTMRSGVKPDERVAVDFHAAWALASVAQGMRTSSSTLNTAVVVMSRTSNRFCMDVVGCASYRTLEGRGPK